MAKTTAGALLAAATLLAVASSEQQTATISCPAGYSLLGLSCFLVSHAPMAGSLAEQFCHGNAGAAAVVETQEEMDLLRDSFLNTTVHLGINIKKYRENMFSFLLKMAGHTGYTSFHSGEPDNYASETCVVADAATNYEWKDIHCTEHHPVLCKTEPVVSPRAKRTQGGLLAQGGSSRRPSCAADAHQLNNTCFWVDGGLAYNWTEAKAACNRRGMYLASISSQEENDFVFGLTHGIQTVWLGLNDLAQEGVYEWSDGSELSYMNWGSGQPGGVEQWDCVGMRTSGAWAEYGCGHHLGAACRGTAR